MPGEPSSDLPIVFVAGLPRSGSTLLLNLLGQNPAFHVTPTNGLVDEVAALRDRWGKNISFRSQGIDKIQPRIEKLIRGMIEGFYSEEFAAGKRVFDKNRGWVGQIPVIEKALGRRVQVIVTVRDIRAVIASFEKLHRRSVMTEFRAPGTPGYIEARTVEGRTRMLIGPASVVGGAIDLIRDAIDCGLGDRLIFVPYAGFVNDPKITMTLLHALLGIAPFEYDPENVEQITHEDDSFHGMDLHRIRSLIRPPETNPWQGVLSEKICKELVQSYADIQELASSRPHPFMLSMSPNEQKAIEQVPPEEGTDEGTELQN